MYELWYPVENSDGTQTTDANGRKLYIILGRVEDRLAVDIAICQKVALSKLYASSTGVLDPQKFITYFVPKQQCPYIGVCYV